MNSLITRSEKDSVRVSKDKDGVNELIKNTSRLLHKSQSRRLSAEFRDNLTNDSELDE